MRRVTYMVRLHQTDKRPDFYKISWVPMQRTEYYMPWGVVRVDELSKMEYDLERIVVTFCDERCAWHGRP